MALLAAFLLAGAVRSDDERVRRGSRLALFIAAVTIVAPAAIALAGLDFYSGRNVSFALVPLTVAVGGGAVRRTGAAALAGVCALQLAVVVASFASPGLQRPDWRSVAERIGPLRPGQAVAPARTGDDALRCYLGARAMPEAGSPVRRLHVVTFAPYPPARPAGVARPPAGFGLTGVESVGPFRLYGLRSPAPRRLPLESWKQRFPGVAEVLVGPSRGPAAGRN